jgi:hypothetical protein
LRVVEKVVQAAKEEKREKIKGEGVFSFDNVTVGSCIGNGSNNIASMGKNVYSEGEPGELSSRSDEDDDGDEDVMVKKSAIVDKQLSYKNQLP